MKKIIFILLLSLVLSACGEKEIVFPEQKMKFRMEVDETEYSGSFVPYITLDMDTNETVFFYDVASSYLGIGTFELKDNILTLKDTDDGKMENSVYVFKVIDEYTLEFMADQSSEPRLYNKQLGVVPVDGTRFIAEE